MKAGRWWDTVPYLGRDPRRPDDVDTRGPGHAADATRYALRWSAGNSPRALYGAQGWVTRATAEEARATAPGGTMGSGILGNR